METTTSPAPRRPSPAPHQGAPSEAVSSWNRPQNNPHRSALLASASQKLADAARRIEWLQDQLAALGTQSAQSSLP